MGIKTRALSAVGQPKYFRPSKKAKKPRYVALFVNKNLLTPEFTRYNSERSVEDIVEDMDNARVDFDKEESNYIKDHDEETTNSRIIALATGIVLKIAQKKLEKQEGMDKQLQKARKSVYQARTKGLEKESAVYYSRSLKDYVNASEETALTEEAILALSEYQLKFKEYAEGLDPVNKKRLSIVYGENVFTNGSIVDFMNLLARRGGLKDRPAPKDKGEYISFYVNSVNDKNEKKYREVKLYKSVAKTLLNWSKIEVA